MTRNTPPCKRPPAEYTLTQLGAEDRKVVGWNAAADHAREASRDGYPVSLWGEEYVREAIGWGQEEMRRRTVKMAVWVDGDLRSNGRPKYKAGDIIQTDVGLCLSGGCGIGYEYRTILIEKRERNVKHNKPGFVGTLIDPTDLPEKLVLPPGPYQGGPGSDVFGYDECFLRRLDLPDDLGNRIREATLAAREVELAKEAERQKAYAAARERDEYHANMRRLRAELSALQDPAPF